MFLRIQRWDYIATHITWFQYKELSMQHVNHEGFKKCTQRLYTTSKERRFVRLIPSTHRMHLGGTASYVAKSLLPTKRALRITRQVSKASSLLRHLIPRTHSNGYPRLSPSFVTPCYSVKSSRTALRTVFDTLPYSITCVWETSLHCDMGCWLSCRVSALQSVVAASISSGGNPGIHCWWDLIRSKQQSSVSVCRA